MQSRRITTIIPTRNAAHFLPACLDSVLAQTRRPEEILVIDDASVDATRQVLEPYRGSVRVLRGTGAGPGAARNLGLREAGGALVAFLDADDVWEPSKLELQLESLQASPFARLCFTDATVVAGSTPGAASYLDGRKPSKISRETLLLDNYICTSSVLADRDALMAAGGFAEDLLIAQDYDLWLRLLERNEAVFIDSPLVRYRDHSGGISRDFARNVRETLEVLGRRAPVGGIPLRARIFPLSYTLGHLCLQEGDTVQARCAFERAVRARPWSPLAWIFFMACMAGPRVAIPLKGAVAALGRLIKRGE